MIQAFCFLIGVQLAGSFLADTLSMPIPGPVIGMLLLLIWLTAGGWAPADLGLLADGFVRYLPLLFVPASVGLVQYLDLLSAFGVVLFAVIVGSTLMGLIVAAFVFSLVAAKLSPPTHDEQRQGERFGLTFCLSRRTASFMVVCHDGGLSCCSAVTEHA